MDAFVQIASGKCYDVMIWLSDYHKLCKCSVSIDTVSNSTVGWIGAEYSRKKAIIFGTNENIFVNDDSIFAETFNE